MRRLQKYGVTRSELERYTMALLRDSEQAAESASCIPSLEMLDYSMESIGLDHVIMDQRQVPSCPCLPALIPWALRRTSTFVVSLAELPLSEPKRSSPVFR